MRWLESDALGKEVGPSPIAWRRSIRKGPLGIAERGPSLTIHGMQAGRFTSPSLSVLSWIHFILHKGILFLKLPFLGHSITLKLASLAARRLNPN